MANNRFLYPVSMAVTHEQKEYLKGELIKLGYIWKGSYEERYNCICTDYGGNDWIMGEIPIEDKTHFHRYFIDHYNPQLFLALAAQRELGGRRCYYKDRNGHIYQLVDTIWTHSSEQLATKEELIAHFTTTKTDEMDKEQIQQQIKELEQNIKFDKGRIERLKILLQQKTDEMPIQTQIESYKEAIKYFQKKIDRLEQQYNQSKERENVIVVLEEMLNDSEDKDVFIAEFLKRLSEYEDKETDSKI